MENMTTEEFQKKWVTTGEVAKMIPFLTYATIRQYMHERSFPFEIVKIADRLFADREGVKKYVEERMKQNKKQK